jgi:ribose/xylose/arabinose/galactoside ABC-type transport system permease subunit
MSVQSEQSIDAGSPPQSGRERLGRKSRWSIIFGRREVILLLINLGFILGMTLLSPYFFTVANFRVMIVGMAMETIVLAAMVILLVGGMFDLSVDGVVNMTGVITGALLVQGIPIPVAIGVGLLAGGFIGLVNGVAVTRLKMNPLMTTLGTWWVAQGIAYGLTAGISSHGFPQEFKDLGLATPLGVPMPVWYMIVLVPLAILLLAKTRFGYHVYATGGNREASRLHGVLINRVTIISFILVALAAALTGIIYAARLNAAVPNAVNGMNLRVIAGAVIGGCALTGGEGNIIGALLGLLFMTMLTNASVILGISPYWQISVLGIVVLVAVWADALAKRRVPSS